ncbi:MAG: DUF5908 family protein [Sphingomonas sp.]
MALEISEIGVHIAIGHAPPPSAPAPSTGASAGTPPVDPMTPARVEAIVQSCVQQVLRELRLREGR